MSSFKVLKANKQLVIFPILSSISLVLILASFVIVVVAGTGGTEFLDNFDPNENILFVFLYYLVNYFVVVFFNMALIHCTRLYFRGEEVTIEKGIKFSLSRVGTIFAWSMLAATVGTILRLLEENLGWIGKIVISLVGVAWSIATFFVVPVIAYENVGPFDALKRSTTMMKNKWGESIGAGFSFGLVQLIGFLVVGGGLFLVGAIVNIVVGIVLAVIGVLLVSAIISAAQTIFISAVYHNINGDMNEHFNQQMIDNLFKKK